MRINIYTPEAKRKNDMKPTNLKTKRNETFLEKHKMPN